MGNPNATDEKVEEAARQSGCDSFIRALENGYDTVAGGGGGHLSGGEKQRISIARALLKDAPIVILDEATASVDPENEKELVGEPGLYYDFLNARKEAVGWKVSR